MKPANNKTLDIEGKRLFLIIASDLARVNRVRVEIEKHIHNVSFVHAFDSKQAYFKAANQRPHVVVIDTQSGDGGGKVICTSFLNQYIKHRQAIIWVTALPEDQDFVDHVVTGRVQFSPSVENSKVFAECCSKAMNFIAAETDADYSLRFLSKGEVLFEQGAKAEKVYILRTGELEALKLEGDKSAVLGKVLPGEFVGEMAHINQDVRSATVRATVQSELIEIPIGALDLILFSKPAWAKALVATLGKRLKRQNDVVAETKAK